MVSRYGKSVAEARPELIAQWSPRNAESAYEVKPGSSRKFWWVGPCGHEWEAPADNRVYNGTGCPFCATRGWKKLRSGENDLATRFPEVAAEWHPTLNDCLPSETLPGIKKHAWWLCSTCGREWRALLNMRTSRGTGCPSCRGRRRGLKNSGSIADTWLRSEWSDRNRMPIESFPPGSRELAWWRCKNGHEFQAAIGDRLLKDTGCKQCGLGGSSQSERDLSDFVSSLGFSVRNHHRQIDHRFEYDVTVADSSLAIEFNGIYWHSEEKKGARYHYDKTLAAQRQGWAVLHVWEDDWRVRRPIVERMIARKLGVSNEPRLNARSLQAGYATPGESREFLDANHIQGATPGSARLALRDDSGAIRALMLFRRRKGGAWELSRYATDAIVRGGFTRLLKRFIAEYAPDKIVTFSDNATSDGSLYEGSGFVRDGEIPPDYMYIVKGTRVHKFNYRLKRFRDDPNLEYREGATERELADLNGLDRIYDAGKVRWVLTLR